MSCIDIAFWSFCFLSPWTRNTLRFLLCATPLCVYLTMHVTNLPGFPHFVCCNQSKWGSRNGVGTRLSCKHPPTMTFTSSNTITLNFHTTCASIPPPSYSLSFHRVPSSTRAVTFGRWFGSRRRLASSCSTSVLKGEWWVFLALHPVRKPERRIDLNAFLLEFLLRS